MPFWNEIVGEWRDGRPDVEPNTSTSIRSVPKPVPALAAFRGIVSSNLFGDKFQLVR